VGEVECRGETGAQFAQGLPGERGDPGAEREWSPTETRAVGTALLGVAARGGIDPEVVDADAVALLVMLARALLVQQIEGRRRVIVEDEEP
jgi:hypothetical protein